MTSGFIDSHDFRPMIFYVDSLGMIFLGFLTVYSTRHALDGPEKGSKRWPPNGTQKGSKRCPLTEAGKWCRVEYTRPDTPLMAPKWIPKRAPERDPKGDPKTAPKKGSKRRQKEKKLGKFTDRNGSTMDWDLKTVCINDI